MINPSTKAMGDSSVVFYPSRVVSSGGLISGTEGEQIEGFLWQLGLRVALVRIHLFTCLRKVPSWWFAG
ncbi:hypothetical protein SLEP1_g36481 [Rubroshorea leprosula]|uniref:Uncharacterized protein n=1 Tax=Rubroshorea leprosula TaxID=152421 RepID=A0AAV5KRL1_9ROSI|nr:hypothetical protein SLEP1_g36481 [Rubroshorea leprosula]